MEAMMTDKLEASRLTPDTLRELANTPEVQGEARLVAHLHATAWAADIDVARMVREGNDSLAQALADSGKRIPTEFLGRPIAYWVELDNYAKERNVDKLIGEIERLREQLLVRQVEALELAEQLRAYRGAERIARDQMEAPRTLQSIS